MGKRWRQAGATTWQDVKDGDAGAEEVNVVHGSHDQIYVFTFPGGNGTLNKIESDNLVQSFTTTSLPGS